MPDLTVIDGDGPPTEERVAGRKVGWASRELAANILRIIRGAGKPEALVDQIKAFLDAGYDYQDVAGNWPVLVIADALKIESEYSKFMERAERGEVDDATIDRMHERQMFAKMHAEHHIRRGALQSIASRLVDQPLQEASGDREIRDGIHEIERIGEERRKADRQAAKRARSIPGKKPRTLRAKPDARKPPL
jgi:hypothetical protein